VEWLENNGRCNANGSTATDIPCSSNQTKPTEHRMNIFGLHTECEGPRIDNRALRCQENGGREAMSYGSLPELKEWLSKTEHVLPKAGRQTTKRKRSLRHTCDNTTVNSSASSSH
jgi:hypothetical protein